MFKSKMASKTPPLKVPWHRKYDFVFSWSRNYMDTNHHNQSEFWCWLNEIFVILSSLTNSPLKKLPNVLNRESRRVTSHEWGRGRNRLAPYGKAMEENYVSHTSADIAATVGKLWGLTCVTFGCNNRTLQGVSLHKFPLKQNPILAKEWKKRAGSWKAAHLTALAKKKKVGLLVGIPLR